MRKTLGALLCTVLLAGCGQDWGSDHTGKAVTAKDRKDHWVLVNYWAEWCAPCRKEIPELNQLNKDDGILVLGVNYDDLTGEELTSAIQDMGIEFRVLQHDPSEQLHVERGQALPTTLLIDPQGKVREQLLGEQTERSLRDAIARLQQEG